MLLITAKQNVNNSLSLSSPPEKPTSSCTISKKQTLPSNGNIIEFHSDDGLKKEHISKVNKVKKVFVATDNNQIKTKKQKR